MKGFESNLIYRVISRIFIGRLEGEDEEELLCLIGVRDRKKMRLGG